MKFVQESLLSSVDSDEVEDIDLYDDEEDIISDGDVLKMTVLFSLSLVEGGMVGNKDMARSGGRLIDDIIHKYLDNEYSIYRYAVRYKVGSAMKKELLDAWMSGCNSDPKHMLKTCSFIIYMDASIFDIKGALRFLYKLCLILETLNDTSQTTYINFQNMFLLDKGENRVTIEPYWILMTFRNNSFPSAAKIKDKFVDYFNLFGLNAKKRDVEKLYYNRTNYLGLGISHSTFIDNVFNSDADREYRNNISKCMFMEAGEHTAGVYVPRGVTVMMKGVVHEENEFNLLVKNEGTIVHRVYYSSDFISNMPNGNYIFKSILFEHNLVNNFIHNTIVIEFKLFVSIHGNNHPSQQGIKHVYIDMAGKSIRHLVIRCSELYFEDEDDASDFIKFVNDENVKNVKFELV